MVIVALSSKIKRIPCFKFWFQIYNKFNEAEYYNWEDVESFGFTQAPFGNGVLEISIKDQKALRFEMKLRSMIQILARSSIFLNPTFPVTKPRYFKLFKKGQHFAENRTVAFLSSWITHVTAGIVFASIPLTEAYSDSQVQYFSAALAFLITGIGRLPQQSHKTASQTRYWNRSFSRNCQND